MTSRLCALLLALAIPASALAGDAKPAAAPEKPAAEARKPVPGTEPDPKIFQEMFTCMSEGLVPEWKRAWVTVVELDRTDDGKSRNYEAIFRYAVKDDDKEGQELLTCNGQQVIAGVADLNDYLKPDQRNWTEVTVTFYSEGKYEAKYGYTPIRKPGAKPAAAKPEARPAAKPAAKPAAGDSKAGFKIGQ